MSDRTTVQWGVAYGGEDGNDCAGVLHYDDEADAAECAQWMRGGFVVRRTVTTTPWETVTVASTSRLAVRQECDLCGELTFHANDCPQMRRAKEG